MVKHWLASARADDAARGVEWPTITPDQMSQAGLAWSIFPNMTILHGIHLCACAIAHVPTATIPTNASFESYAIRALSGLAKSRKPSGSMPNRRPRNGGVVLAQDYSNMAAVQRGMRSRGFRGSLPNPHQERKVTNFHRNLANYMGAGAPKVIK